MRARRVLTSIACLTAIVVTSACRHEELPGAAEPTTAECPTIGERACREASDCGPNLHCTGGQCFANQAGCPCSTDDQGDCGSKAHCTRGQCYSNEAGVPCTENKHCGPRAHCTVDTCYENASGSPCTEGSDCGPSSKCVSGRCN
ncbi:MAG: hypothetical protein KIT84_08545 [Labilithrix sp.]|nr:hypothetical protein [Labilithrix sp.]MCW5811047.1 hypothetical protein [Labilithrix sp.]